jgi:MOSC N-terminal beta barrel domain
VCGCCGRPTGDIRVSFGKVSLWEDLDMLVRFWRGTFMDEFEGVFDVLSSEVAAGSHGVEVEKSAYHLQTTAETTAEFSKVFVFPMKSCPAQPVSRWMIELASGKFRCDREFALVDTSGTVTKTILYQNGTE